MNLLSSFNDFYNGLSSDGLFFFWIIIFLFCFLVFLAIVLVIKNKKLVKLLKNENLDYEDDEVVKSEIPVVEKEINEDKIVFEEKEEKILEIKGDTSVLNDELIIEKEENNKKVEVKEESGPYKKNILREMNARMQTSPISISNNDVNYNTVSDDDYDDNYGFDESYLREETVSPLEMMEDSYEINDGMKFASDIVERMEEEIKPSNIELTDYEKKQEEEAIIIHLFLHLQLYYIFYLYL